MGSRIVQTEELIQQLSKRSRPVRRLAPPRVRLIRWLGAAFFCVGAGVLLLGVRSDILEALREPAYVLQAAIILLLGTLSASAAFSLSVPNRNLSARVKWVPVIVLGIWLVYLLFASMLGMGAPGTIGLGMSCIRDIIFLGLPPGILLFAMIARAAPLQVRLTGVFVSLSVSAFGALGSQLVCRDDGILHILAWHFVPVLVIGALGTILGRRIAQWEAQ